MKNSYLLSPQQSASYDMGRLLLVLAAWYLKKPEEELELDRAMVIDFGVRFPRAFIGMVPEVGDILERHGFARSDLADYFVTRKFASLREHFVDTVVDLVSRELVDQVQNSERAEFFAIRLTPSGFRLAEQFSSKLSQITLLLASAYVDAWGDINIKKLLGSIRSTLPDTSQMVHELTRPFGSWLSESENG